MKSDSSMNQTLNYGENHFIRNLEPDQLPDFKLEDCISSNVEIEGKHCPPPFKFVKPKIQ